MITSRTCSLTHLQHFKILISSWYKATSQWLVVSHPKSLNNPWGREAITIIPLKKNIHKHWYFVPISATKNLIYGPNTLTTSKTFTSESNKSIFSFVAQTNEQSSSKYELDSASINKLSVSWKNPRKVTLGVVIPCILHDTSTLEGQVTQKLIIWDNFKSYFKGPELR